METQRNFLFITTLVLAAVLWMKWQDFSNPVEPQPTQNVQSLSGAGDLNVPQANNSVQTIDNSDEVPSAPSSTSLPAQTNVPNAAELNSDSLVVIETDLIIAKINPKGAVIESLELRDQPVSLKQPEQGFPLLKNTAAERFVAQDGLVTVGGQQPAPNHASTMYSVAALEYKLDSQDQLEIPFTWRSANGIVFTKTFTFKRDSYVVDINYNVNNQSTTNWAGSVYAQFLSTEIEKKGGGFGQLPSYTGAAVYTDEEKYEKISYGDMRDENYSRKTNQGWAAMLQHYFVGAWIPQGEGVKTIYSDVSLNRVPATYRIGYKNENLTTVAAGTQGNLNTSVYLGSKEQKRLKALQKDKDIKGLALTVDYGFLTFIADPLFIVLSWIHDIVGNWGWSIILLTLLIKIVFYPLSAASYRSMAGMKKIQPRLQTLKERYKDDRQKFQMEMMALYKKEKINPAGGCLPILIQIPVFIALYWVLLESVEMRHAPFALWWQDLSAPDPYFVLPILMGLSMWAQQKLNPAPMEDIQKKVMMIMPFALTFLFLNFPQGLVLYWVVNNVLSIAQQWLINKQNAV